MANKSRRRFIWLIYSSFSGLILLLWNKLTLSHIRLSEKKEYHLPLNKNKEISFFDDFIVIYKEKKLTVFSSRCTHLGCKIDKFEGDKLICPCHGSEYDLNGNPQKGPAYKKLETVEAKLSSDGNTLEIEI